MRGEPTPRQWAAIQKSIHGRHVHDLGACDGALTVRLAEHASYVVGVEKDPYTPPTHPKIEWVQTYFDEYDAKSDVKIDVAFLSWPANRRSVGLFSMIYRAKTVIYLGKNTDGIVCGVPEIFQLFAYRKLEVYIPHHRNSLVILGEQLDDRRELTGEEYAGLMAFDGPVLSFDKAEALKAQPEASARTL